MFTDLETAIRDLLAGTIPAIPVLGTWDRVDMTADGAKRIAMQVEYQGFDALQNKPGAVTLGPRFAVHVVVDAGAALVTERAAAEAGMQTTIERLLAWPPPLEVEIQSSPLIQLDGRELRMSVFFTLAPVVVTAN